jgi:hypothetical protein
MPNSLNASFVSPQQEPVSDESRPGGGIAAELAKALDAEGWTAATPDDWRDAGWQFVVRRDAAELTVVLAQIDKPGEFLLQVVPTRTSGIISRLVGGRPSATTSDISKVAQVIHRSLEQHGGVGISWRWDGKPKRGVENAKPPSSS